MAGSLKAKGGSSFSSFAAVRPRDGLDAAEWRAELMDELDVAEVEAGLSALLYRSAEWM